MSRNDKQTPESVKFPLEERERQNKSETLKRVKKFPMGLPLSPKLGVTNLNWLKAPLDKDPVLSTQTI